MTSRRQKQEPVWKYLPEGDLKDCSEDTGQTDVTIHSYPEDCYTTD